MAKNQLLFEIKLPLWPEIIKFKISQSFSEQKLCKREKVEIFFCLFGKQLSS